MKKNNGWILHQIITFFCLGTRFTWRWFDVERLRSCSIERRCWLGASKIGNSWWFTGTRTAWNAVYTAYVTDQPFSRHQSRNHLFARAIMFVFFFHFSISQENWAMFTSLAVIFFNLYFSLLRFVFVHIVHGKKDFLAAILYCSVLRHFCWFHGSGTCSH